MKKEIKIKSSYIVYLIFSILFGFSILYILQHYGKFSYMAKTLPKQENEKASFVEFVSPETGVVNITFETFFKNTVTTNGNGFNVGDLYYSDSNFYKYSNKSYYFTQAVLKDYIYGLYLSLAILVLLIFFSEFKIKIS